MKISVVTAEQMRNLDRRATEEYGIPSVLLMENAGRAVFNAAVEMLGDVRGKHVVVVAGQGNNGGDGFVVARFLHNAGAHVRIFYFGNRSAAKGDALTNIEIAEKMKLDIDNSGSTRKLKAAIAECDLVIDALLGTGIKGELRPDAAKVVGCMNERIVPLLAVDIPSGIDADTGKALGPDSRRMEDAVRAEVTVTFALPKIGLVTASDGAGLAGKLIVADIGIPKEALVDNGSNIYLLNSKAVFWPEAYRPCFAHKGTFGHVAIVAGSVGMTGAATLSAQGALRVGTGLVTLAVPESLNDIMEVKLTEAMTIPVLQADDARAFGMKSLDSVLEIIAKRDSVVIGPGFGRNEDTIAFTLELMRHLDKPAIIDADALFALSTNLNVLKKCKAPVIITPHPGEMATLEGTTAAEVQSNRLDIASKFASKYGVTVVLKGARTVIAEPEGKAWINTSGTPGMATGGTGDVLSGMIGGLLAQSEMQPWGIATSAVYVHGRAGELAAERLGEASMLASDLVDSLPAAIQEVLAAMPSFE